MRSSFRGWAIRVARMCVLDPLKISGYTVYMYSVSEHPYIPSESSMVASPLEGRSPERA